MFWLILIVGFFVLLAKKWVLIAHVSIENVLVCIYVMADSHPERWTIIGIKSIVLFKTTYMRESYRIRPLIYCVLVIK